MRLSESSSTADDGRISCALGGLEPPDTLLGLDWEGRSIPPLVLEKLGGRTRSIEDLGLGMEACLLTLPGTMEVDLEPGLVMPEETDLIVLGGTIPLALPALSVSVSRFEVSALLIAKAPCWFINLTVTCIGMACGEGGTNIKTCSSMRRSPSCWGEAS